MSKRDSIHFAVKSALEKENWEITDDPYQIELEEGKKFRADLGAQKIIAAQRGIEKIVIEIKSFSPPSVLHSFHEAFGQYLNYRDALIDSGINRELYISISDELYFEINEIPFLKRQLARYNFKVLVVNVQEQKIAQWVK